MPLDSRFEEMLQNEAKKRRMPLNGKFELLPVCNLNCRMCYVRQNMESVHRQGGLISAERWLNLAREMRDAGVLNLVLSGGEIFMYPRIRMLYEALYQMGFYITLNTNATLIDEETADWIRTMPPKMVSISVYGASNETYEALCGQKGMFYRVDRAIHLLKERGIKMELKTMLNPLNEGDAQAISDYAKRVGVFYYADSYTYPPSRKELPIEPYRFEPLEAAKHKILFMRREKNDRDFAQYIYSFLKKYEDTKDLPGDDIYGFTCGREIQAAG